MKLGPGEAALLIIRRSDVEPKKYFFAVRKSDSSFNDQTKDLRLVGVQDALLELGGELDFGVALEKAIAAIREIQP